MELEPLLQRALSKADEGDWVGMAELLREHLTEFENEPAVTSLLAENPFPDRAPRYLRARCQSLHFSDPQTREESGCIWRVEELDLFLPVVENPARVAAGAGAVREQR